LITCIFYKENLFKSCQCTCIAPFLKNNGPRLHHFPGMKRYWYNVHQLINKDLGILKYHSLISLPWKSIQGTFFRVFFFFCFFCFVFCFWFVFFQIHKLIEMSLNLSISWLINRSTALKYINTLKNRTSKCTLKKHNLYLLKFLPCDVLQKSNNMNGKNMNHKIHPVKR
jgi:hypothetical protein